MFANPFLFSSTPATQNVGGQSICVFANIIGFYWEMANYDVIVYIYIKSIAQFDLNTLTGSVCRQSPPHSEWFTRKCVWGLIQKGLYVMYRDTSSPISYIIWFSANRWCSFSYTIHTSVCKYIDEMGEPIQFNRMCRGFVENPHVEDANSIDISNIDNHFTIVLQSSFILSDGILNISSGDVVYRKITFEAFYVNTLIVCKYYKAR